MPNRKEREQLERNMHAFREFKIRFDTAMQDNRRAIISVNGSAARWVCDSADPVIGVPLEYVLVLNNIMVGSLKPHTFNSIDIVGVKW